MNNVHDEAQFLESQSTRDYAKAHPIQPPPSETGTTNELLASPKLVIRPLGETKLKEAIDELERAVAYHAEDRETDPAYHGGPQSLQGNASEARRKSARSSLESLYRDLELENQQLRGLVDKYSASVDEANTRLSRLISEDGR